MTTPKIDIVMSDDGDWEGMYVDGVLKCEDHSLDAQQVLYALGLEFHWKETFIRDGGRLPHNFSDLR